MLDVLRTVAARHEVSPARVAIAWLLAQRAVTSVIVGARKLEQLTDNIAASDLTLTEQDLAELDEVSRPPVAYPNWIQEGFAPARIPAANPAGQYGAFSLSARSMRMTCSWNTGSPFRRLRDGFGDTFDERRDLVGRDTIGTWLEAISTVVAPIRWAKWRSASGGIASSSVPPGTRRAGPPCRAPITSPSAASAIGCWTACMTRAQTGSTSAAKCSTKSSSASQP